MSVYVIVALNLFGYGTAVLLGWMIGRDDERSRERAWAEGYAAGLERSDEWWPAVARRWAME
jgi:Na+-driven multidrug efflux pump